MEVFFTPEQEARIAHVAEIADTEPELFVKLAVLRLLEGGSEAKITHPSDVVAEMRELRSRLMPDPEGWSTRDYVLQGRR